jgi:ferric-dicitrate binding protein FerR (iron transport regulator)
MDKFDDTFLARWLNDKLTEDEETRFKSSDEYSTYLKIIEQTQSFKSPEYDLNKNFIKIKEARQKSNIIAIQKRKKNVRFIGIAASFILLLGIFSFLYLFNTTEYSSDFGKKLTFELPDGSKVMLNAKSTIKYNKQNWENERVLTLNGDAYFDVEKGKKFTVKTPQGNIIVLGTEFNVNASTDFLKVVCYEGKVRVHDNINNKNIVLTPTEGYQNTIKNDPLSLTTKNNEPEWIQNISVFESTPLKNVFETLEKQYDLSFKYNNLDDSILFTGSFPNNNKEIALKSVLKSLNLKYSINRNKIILED